MFKHIVGRLSGSSPARLLLARADAARDERRFTAAAALYEEAIRMGGAGGGVHVQAGHMFKEAGALDAAERHYARAVELMPDDADLALQRGHFYKVGARLRDAEREYRRALRLDPGLTAATAELAHLADRIGLATAPGASSAPMIDFAAAGDIALDQAAQALARSGGDDGLVADIMPRPASDLLVANGESIHIRRLGRPYSSRWGMQPMLRGVEAIRGFCLSATPIVELQILLNGQAIWRGPVRAYPLRNERENPDLRKYVFNVWLDFSQHRPGRYHLELRFRDVHDTQDPHGGRRAHRDYVVVMQPVAEPRFKGGDGWTPPTDPEDARSVEDQINARPSTVRAAARSIFAAPIRNVLVARTDQLGDVVVSVPAMRRLRTLLPDARMVGLFTSANADLVRTLGLFDDVIVVDFPEIAEQRKRVMTAAAQQALRDLLAPYRFDLALDLAPAGVSRPILQLSGAAFLAGFGDNSWKWLLDAGFDFNTHDSAGGSDIMPASAKTLAFIEALATMMSDHATIVRRPDLSRDRLEAYGIGAGDRYAVLHTGARVVFSRWASYNALAARLLAETDLKVAMLSEDPTTRAGIPPALLDDPRFRLIDTRLPFDDFDALLSFCAVFAGNDSGPKHLAALRGSNVVSLHTARINWGEWGQEQTGKIISRQVPCAGCHIYDEPEDCGRDFVCVAAITVDEVFDAMREYC